MFFPEYRHNFVGLCALSELDLYFSLSCPLKISQWQHVSWKSLKDWSRIRHQYYLDWCQSCMSRTKGFFCYFQSQWQVGSWGTQTLYHTSEITAAPSLDVTNRLLAYLPVVLMFTWHRTIHHGYIYIRQHLSLDLFYYFKASNFYLYILNVVAS